MNEPVLQALCRIWPWRQSNEQTVIGEFVSGEWTTKDGEVISGEFVTVNGLAKLLDVTKFTVHYHIREGHIPTKQVGRTHLIERELADQIVAQYQRNKTWPTPGSEQQATRSPGEEESGPDHD